MGAQGCGRHARSSRALDRETAAGCEKKGNTSETAERQKGTEANGCQIVFQDERELSCQAKSTQEIVLQNLYSLVFSQIEILSECTSQ